MTGAAPTMTDSSQAGSRAKVLFPANFGRGFLRAVEEVFGPYSLHVLQDDLGWEAQHSQLAGETGERLGELSTANFAALQRVIREYYGTGARGRLNQVGRRSWRTMVESAPLSQRLGMFALRLQPVPERKRKGLEYLAGWLSLPDQPVTVQEADAGLQVRDPLGATAIGQTSDEPLCWVMVGMIQEAVLWASGEDAEVIETACRAQGAEACLFLIRG